jgi:hypothetical protein
MQVNDMIMMPVPISRYTDVCALLGGVSSAALSAGKPSPKPSPTDNGGASQGTEQSSENTGGSPENGASAGTGPAAMTDASPSDGEIDAHGHPWSAELHASTKGKTKDGLWRMKVGVTRPDPLPGFPVASGTGTSSAGTEAQPTPSATSQTATGPATDQPATSTDDEDEFAAFRNAAASSEATDAAAAAAVPAAREYTDADLGALCNQAAVKLGDPGPVKAVIAKYMPEGTVAHSRNVPADKRADFVKEIETAAGITFAG